ncbi:MAG: FHA domain-containing protein [Lachnospiraceae bacterium]|nr:FHA domain-containing protein [Lachnospiraceae bacterium]
MGDSTIELYGNTLLNNRYTIIKSLGIGGFGITYQAYDNYRQCKCAIKEYFPRGVVIRLGDKKSVVPVSDSKRGIYDHGKERFLEEAEILQRLKNVPSVVSVYDFFQDNQTCYFVMEYLDGYTLSSLVKANKKGLDYSIVADAIGQVGRALIQVHKHNYFHRDISPDNIFVTSTGKVKLIDFGSAKNIVRNENQVLSVVLKPGFAPPEQYSSKGVQGTFTDVYALASTMYYLLTAKMFPGAFDRSNDDDYIHLSEYGFSTTISDAVNKALRLNYRERTQTVEDFLRDLNISPEMPSGQSSSQGNEVGVGNTGTSATELDLSGGINLPKQVLVNIQAIKPAESKKPVPSITFQNGNRYNLPLDSTIVIGRSPEFAQIVINEAHISKKHCELYYDSKKNMFYIQDNSTNGTYVNGGKLVRGTAYQVAPGSVVAIGGNNCIGRVGVTFE